MSNTVARVVARNVKPNAAVEVEPCHRCRFVGSLDGDDCYYCDKHGAGEVIKYSPRGSAAALPVECASPGTWAGFVVAAHRAGRPAHAYVTVTV